MIDSSGLEASDSKGGLKGLPKVFPSPDTNHWSDNPCPFPALSLNNINMGASRQIATLQEHIIVKHNNTPHTHTHPHTHRHLPTHTQENTRTSTHTNTHTLTQTLSSNSQRMGTPGKPACGYAPSMEAGASGQKVKVNLGYLHISREENTACQRY